MPQKYDEYHLHRLCRDGGFEDVYHFLEDNGNRTVNKYDQKGYAPIHYAVKRDSDIDHVLGLLFTHDVDVNSRSLKDGDTAMHMLVERFEEEEATTLCLKLLSHGADPDYRNDKYRTPFDIAMAKEMLHLADLLSDDITQDDAQEKLDTYRKNYYGQRLIKAILDGDTEDVTACIKHGADVDIMNEHGAAGIHYTITHCPAVKVTVLQHLINAEADVNLQDYEGDTALNLVIKTASERSNRETKLLVETLLSNGADPSIKDLDGKDSFYLAEMKGYGEILDLLGLDYSEAPEDFATTEGPGNNRKGRPRKRAGYDDNKRNEEGGDDEDDDNEDKKKNKTCVIL